MHTLLEHDLVDEYRLMFDPVVVGDAKRLFVADGIMRKLHLADCRPTPTGAMILHLPAPRVRFGLDPIGGRGDRGGPQAAPHTHPPLHPNL